MSPEAELWGFGVGMSLPMGPGGPLGAGTGGMEDPGRTGLAVMAGTRAARARVMDDSRKRMAIVLKVLGM